jgi:hypothetical protein
VKTFIETKTELLAKAKACGACPEQYNRAKKITTIRGLARIITDNWFYACRHQLITTELLNAIPKYDEPSIFNITSLIQSQPEFIDFYDTANFEGWHYRRILCYQPQLIERFKSVLGELDNIDIYHLLDAQPQLITYFPEYVNPHN